MNCYIRATGNISPQLTAGHPPFLAGPLQEYTGTRMNCAEPDYKDLIDVKLIRRMSRIIRMGVAAATECLQEAGVSMPDAIVTGTAYGCLEDTGHFISRMVSQNEELLTPTAFIQSTHNTIGAQIGLMLKCNRYNNAFVHRGFSFESALLDAMMLLQEEEAQHVLVGGIDEITDYSHTILSRMGLYRRGHASNLDLLEQPSRGTMAGEGAAFFLVASERSATDYARLDGLATLYKPDGPAVIEQKLNSFLEANQLDFSDIDLVINGRNGDLKHDQVYDELKALQICPQVSYKQLCGEYPTSTAFAVWMAANILKSGDLPPLLAPSVAEQEKINRILIYNQYGNIHHSFVLLSAC
ncbi:MAG: beta-ketoacyl synthase chain length factor [Chitinophagaceae bacterium]|nr:beta-ketoacyl synthase chain length factor [Chitinophagaceae bacterium]MBL0055110.1 beta-ketoacyl synthase chain length factor [Chitinophagaceae bacterium]